MGKLWSIGIFDEKKSGEIFGLSNVVKVFNSRKLRLSKRHIHTYADPFLVSYLDDLYLFAEIQEVSGKGYINVWKTKDLKSWKNLNIVLKEDFHLSYPFVFYDQSSSFHYLIPESQEAIEVALYQFQDFPVKPIKIAVLLKGKFVDSSLVYVNEVYYLITTNSDNGELQLYYSDKLVSENWSQHPMSPISNDRRVSRNGGGFISMKDKLYRIAQNCEEKYGGSIVVLEVNKLTKEFYEEAIVEEDFMPKINPKWQNEGRHHLSIAEFNNKTIIAIDGMQKDFWINKGLNFLFKI